MIDLGVGPRDALAVGPSGTAEATPVAALGTLLGEAAQEPHLVQPAGAWVGRQVRGHQLQIERAGLRQLGRPLDRARVAGEAAGLLGSAAQVGTGRGGQPPVGLVEAAPGPHRGQCGGQRPP